MIVRFLPRALRLLLAAAVAIGASHAARDEDPRKPPVVPVPLAASAEAEKKFDDIHKRLAAAKEEFQKKLEAAATDDDRVALFAQRPGKEFAREFQAIALAEKRTELAAKAWVQVAELGWSDAGDSELPKRAVKALIEDHIESKAMVDLPNLLWALDEKEQEAAFALLLEKSPHRNVKANALLVRFFDLQYTAAKDAEAAAQLERVLTRLAREFGDVTLERMPGTYGQFVENYRFAHEHLQVGKVAPDFEALDENGVKWKLSDYKGKVVVVDFWGYW